MNSFFEAGLEGELKTYLWCQWDKDFETLVLHIVSWRLNAESNLIQNFGQHATIVCVSEAAFELVKLCIHWERNNSFP